jgi:hypothetical protein
MSSSLLCCFRFNSLSKFINKQHKDEYYKKKKNMSFIGNNKPKSVYHGYSNELKINDIIYGLNSLCLCDIHIAISNTPPRLILSYINIDYNNDDKKEKLMKGDTFHIFNITYKTITDINDITQYDIYNAIQDYIYLYETIPNNTGNIIIPC